MEPADAMAGRARQYMQESEEDRITRAAGSFADFERDMPKLASRFKFSLKDNLTSYLGSRNPLYSFVDPKKDIVWLFDNTASRNRLGRWSSEFVAAYFVKDSGEELSDVVAWISNKVGLADDDAAKETIAQRVQPLLDSILPAHAVVIDLQGMSVRLGPSGRDGISVDEIAIPGHDFKSGQVITTKAKNSVDATPMNTTFVDPKGFAVISDVDDTIKKTLTPDPLGILKTSFVEDPEPIKGMPELYKHLASKLDNPAFWYLSASPYNLYPFLRGFRDTYYPPGTMILREASWMNLAGFLANLTQGTEAYKVDRIEKIHDQFPKRKFVCIGDSTQTDPEAYGDAYRKWPKWIAAIYIRKVTGVASMDEEKKNASERFEKAFEDVPKEVWHVFEDPQELYQKVDGLASSMHTRQDIQRPALHYQTRRSFSGIPEHIVSILCEIFLTFLAIFISLYFLWLGYICALVWYHNGNLGPEPRRYVIVPARLKEKLDNLTRKSQRIEDPNIGNRRFTMFPAPSRWNGSTMVEINTEGNENEDQDEDIRRAKAEEARISRLPVFEQDDCGDGSNFPDIPEVDHTQYLRPDPAPSFRPRTNYMTMGLKKLDLSSWLRIDNTYRDFYNARSTLLFNRRAEVVQVLPEGEDACEELMREVVNFLTDTYPQLFEIVERIPGRPNSCMERSTFFVQVDPGNVGLEDLLFIQSGKDFFPGNLMNLNPRCILIRRERQTFRRLPESGAIVFTVKTSIQKLTEVPVSERRGLVDEIKAWPPDIATYKGRDLWETQVYRYCEGKLPITIENDVDLTSEAGISTL
ncbi:hypothetical protein K491DRAFT_609057 [Lophiostoma macrostomum CBS 122681]|uniref:Phosphatidate phosphatase APP1 catalytic domain-containing protein n=1 Tax=Lophiostoma macrostomum CBS 122681 TaxID=1314788 RepID=A0A6A6STJ6_9PLEO|nr:hypothetical protein K491DRAFT_609057 [Lophiostoma macrostomum CBS 122681]